jgi:hypothetical protein
MECITIDLPPPQRVQLLLMQAQGAAPARVHQLVLVVRLQRSLCAPCSTFLRRLIFFYDALFSDSKANSRRLPGMLILCALCDKHGCHGCKTASVTLPGMLCAVIWPSAVAFRVMCARRALWVQPHTAVYSVCCVCFLPQVLQYWEGVRARLPAALLQQYWKLHYYAAACAISAKDLEAADR